MTAADLNLEAEKIHAEIYKLSAENAKLAAENAKLTAERDKLSIEPREGTREIFWYPLGIATALVGSVAAITALAIRYLLY